MQWNGFSGQSGRNGTANFTYSETIVLDDIYVDSVCLIVFFGLLMFLGILLYILINTHYFYTIGHVGFEWGRQPHVNAMIVWLENNMQVL